VILAGRAFVDNGRRDGAGTGVAFPAASCEAEDQDPARHRSTPTLRCRPPPGIAAGLRTRDSQIATLWHDINNERLTRSRTSAQRLAAKTTLRTSVPDAAHTL
jgi:hypothetical protein